MANRITGMYSGLDTESLISELVKAKSTKVEKTKKSQTKLQWKQEKWKDLNTKLNSLMSKVGTLRWTTAYQKKAATSSNSAVSVITGEGAMNSVQKLDVNKLASSGYLTGAKLTAADDTTISSDTKLSELKFGDTATAAGTGSFSVTVDGKTTEISVTADTTISDVVSQLNKANVSANFDEKQQRLYIGAKTSGKDADFTITANDANGNSAMTLLGINTGASDATKAQYDSIKAYSSYIVKDGEGNFDAAATMEALEADTTSDAYKLYKEYAKANYKKTLDAANSAVSAQEKVVADLEAKETSEMTEEELAAHNAEVEAAKTELESLKAQKTTVQENYDNEFYDTAAFTQAATQLKDRVEYATQASASTDTSMINTGAVRLTGADAEIELNGVKYTSNSNNITVNGLTFTVNAEVKDVTITTQDDTSGIYDMIKDFFKEYNNIINEIDSLYNADTTTVEPLSDEERDAVSDTEAEKLEKQVKDSLLRRDDTLSSIFSGLRTTMSAGIEVNGQTLYLSNFGINTGSYFSTEEGKRNAYHIDGDSDDSSTSGNADVLKTMIATDSETVVSFFTQLGQNLYKKMSDLSASSDYSSYGSFYDDKKYTSDLSDIKEKIAKQEEEITDFEDKYYDKFTAMEVALSKMQSKTDSISQLFSS